MAKQIQIILPKNYQNSDTILDQTQTYLKSSSLVFGFMRLDNEDNVLLLFSTPTRHVGTILEELEEYDIGTGFGQVTITSLQSTKPRLQVSRVVKAKRKEYRLTDRMSIDEMYETVDQALHLTFDYLMFITVGSIISGIGLASGSSVLVVAAMVISPLMGPILGMTFGSCMNDWDMVVVEVFC